MEFLDPKKQKSHTIRLFIGYGLVGIALILVTTILLYQAYGYGYKNGSVIQNGRVFFSSTPASADIYLNGEKHEPTNTSLSVPAGQYTAELRRNGYRTWKRAIAVDGGTVVRFEYPVLFPLALTTTPVKQYTAAPLFTTQSPDHKWLLTQPAETPLTFELYDLGNPTALAQQLPLPVNVISKTTGAQRFELLEWAEDNRHVLLKHMFTDKAGAQSEYIMLDRQDVSKTVNLTATLGVNLTTLQLRGGAYDQYFLHDQATLTLFTASLKKPVPLVYAQRVLAFKNRGADFVLYATDQDAATGRVTIKLRDGSDMYTIRSVAASERYLLDLSQYHGSWFLAAGSSADRTYVYKNPVDALRGKNNAVLVPVQILKVAQTDYLAFSENGRFVMAQAGSSVAVYDAETDKGYAYQLKTPMDPPQTHLTWIDESHLSTVIGGKLVVFDFDHANEQSLMPATPGLAPAFEKDLKFVFTFAPQADKPGLALTNTPLRTPQDQ